jgi:predicted RecA/RadA family phage recombinase
MADAEYRSGTQTKMPYTSTPALIAGAVVVLGGSTALANTLSCGIAHLDIPAGTTGNLGIGNGIYECTVATATAAYAVVYWDDTAKKVTTVATANALFGYTLQATTGVNQKALVLHKPTGAHP